MKHGEDLDSMVRKAIVRSDLSLTVQQHDAESSFENQLQKLSAFDTSLILPARATNFSSLALQF